MNHYTYPVTITLQVESDISICLPRADLVPILEAARRELSIEEDLLRLSDEHRTAIRQVIRELQGFAERVLSTPGRPVHAPRRRLAAVLEAADIDCLRRLRTAPQDAATMRERAHIRELMARIGHQPRRGRRSEARA